MPLVKTHYQVGKHGKNSSDMAIADDIRTRIDRDPSAADHIDTLVVGTRDRDFTKIIETAKGRGKKVIILGLQQGLSPLLQKLAEVRFIDRELSKSKSPLGYVRAGLEQFSQTMRIADYFEKHHWHWGMVDQLAAVVVPGQDGALLLRELIQDGLLEETGQPGKLQLNRKHPDSYLAGWLVNRLYYLLTKKGMAYVDTSYLARGMLMDANLQQFQIGQTRQAALAELHRAAATGCVMLLHRPHPKDHGKIIETWWPCGFPIPEIELPSEFLPEVPVEAHGELSLELTLDQPNFNSRELPKSF
jgi:hypothetical protein